MGLTAHSIDRLGTWTRTVKFDDLLTLVDCAQPGMSLADWTELANSVLPQANADSRRAIPVVRDELLDHAEGLVLDSAWLRLVRDGSPHRRTGLVLGRLWRNRPLVERALDVLVGPALERCDRPLAPHDSDLIDADGWDRFLADTLPVGVGQTAFTKTRSTLQGALRDVGVVEIAGTTRRTTRVRHGRPDPLAFSWVLGRELREHGEDGERWAAKDSFAARLFAPTFEYAMTCIEAGVDAGLLRKGHLMGQVRFHVGREMA